MESMVVKAGASITLPSNSFVPPTQVLYTLTLNGNGGNNGAPTFTKNTFYRWYDGSKNYEEGKTYQPTAGTTIKARWRSWYKHGATTRSPLEENGYVVTLNPLGGTCKENSLTSKKITKYTFDYWNKNSDGSHETKYDASSEYWLAQDDTRYAIWKQSVSYSSITLPTPQHVTTSTLSITLKYQNGAADSTKTSTKTVSKAFKGWATSQSATSGITGQYTPSSNHTLYAIWDISTTTYSQVTNLPNPIRPGYDFLGWATSASAPSGVFNTYTPTSDIGVLYAIWTPRGTVRIYLDSTNKYKMAMTYIYNPTSDNDTKPWKLSVPYIKDSSSWKILGG